MTIVAMKPFLDSTDILDDAEALRARMERDGYLFIRALLPKRLLEEVRLSWLELLCDAGCVDCDAPPAEGIANPGGFRVEPQPQYMKLVIDLYRRPQTHDIPHDPALMGVMERLVGAPILLHPSIIARYIFPGRTAYTTPAHQDWVPIQGTEQTYTAWIPLSDVPEQMGGVQICAGSHRAGVYNFRPALGAGATQVTDELPDDWRYNPFAQGDVLIFHSRTVHKGMPCRGRRLRLSVDARYQSAAEPVAPASLLNHGGVDWDEIYAGWPPEAEDRKYYWKKLDLKLAAYDGQYNERRDAMAFEMAEAGDTTAISTLQRIIARGQDEKKIDRARRMLARLEGGPAKQV